ncbi:MAG: hypothetical protein KBD83_08590 [Gammaproteobacteria bacterium]|nr:hypothetical protein [Gammaproteobacteria bacterium]
MHLQITDTLSRQYGHKLIDGSITDEELRELMGHYEATTKSALYNGFNPITEENYCCLDAIKDFVLTIGPLLTFNDHPESLHSLVERLIAIAPKLTEPNLLFRDSSLGKAFLAYEIAKYPELAETHFQDNSNLKGGKKGILVDKTSTFTEQGKDLLKGRMLGPQIDFFKQHIENPQLEFVCPVIQKEATKTADSTIYNASNTENTVLPRAGSIVGSIFSRRPSLQMFTSADSSRTPEEQIREDRIRGLKSFIQQYTIGAVLETMRDDNLDSNGISRAEKKADVAKELLEAVQNNLAELGEVFDLALQTYQLTKDEFFTGKTEEKGLPEEFVRFLKSTNASVTMHK